MQSFHPLLRHGAAAHWWARHRRLPAPRRGTPASAARKSRCERQVPQKVLGGLSGPRGPVVLACARETQNASRVHRDPPMARSTTSCSQTRPRVAPRTAGQSVTWQTLDPPGGVQPDVPRKGCLPVIGLILDGGTFGRYSMAGHIDARARKGPAGFSLGANCRPPAWLDGSVQGPAHGRELASPGKKTGPHASAPVAPTVWTSIHPLGGGGAIQSENGRPWRAPPRHKGPRPRRRLPYQRLPGRSESGMDNGLFVGRVPGFSGTRAEGQKQ